MKNLNKETKDEIFRTVEEVVEEYFPNDVDKRRPRSREYGKKWAEETIDKLNKELTK